MEYLQSEARYSSILYTAMDGFAQLDTRGNFIDVNEAYCRLTGYSKQQLLNMSITQIESGENESGGLLKLEKVRSAVHDRFETRHCCADGTLIDLEISITFLPVGTGRFVMFLRNIAERKKNEADIRDITERFTLATRAASMGIWDWDIENDVLVWNDQMLLLYGREKEQSITFDMWKNSIHHDDVQRTLVEIDLALKGIKEFDTEFRIILPDKTIRYVRAISNLYKDASGKAIRLIGTNWDITSERETQREFRKAINEADRANRSKSEFIANMSHEIRTPLNAIIGFSELLETISTDFRQKQYVNSIITAGRSLLRIINDILDMSKIESGMMKVQFAPLELLPIYEEIKQIFTPRIDEKGLKLSFWIDPALPAILYLDEIRLRQVILNLVGNAVKFTDSGYIKISTQPLGTFTIDRPNLDLSIHIEDTGIGIPEEEQNIIFEPFRQRTGQNGAKYGGTGLGLSISKKLTELMNGELSVKSTPAKGSIFTLKLFNVTYKPISKDEHRSLVSHQNESVTFTRSLVLIADDIESNRIVIREHCINAGLEVVEVDNGVDAVTVALELNPHVILMDIRMPKMDGIEALKKIRESETIKDTPVIALSAASNINEINCGTGYNFSLFLSKPVERDRLINAIAQFIPLQIKKQQRRLNREKTSLSPELKVRFKDEFLDRLQSFNGAVRTQSLRALIGELHVFTSEHHSKEIDSLALRLEKAVETFDIEKINSILKKLTDLCA
jgi:PAS domain S-box-containing protein